MGAFFVFGSKIITENRGDLRGLQPRKRCAKFLSISLCPLISPYKEYAMKKNNLIITENFNFYKRIVHIYKNVENIKLMHREINVLIKKLNIKIDANGGELNE
jgi:hypothetical protein